MKLQVISSSVVCLLALTLMGQVAQSKRIKSRTLAASANDTMSVQGAVEMDRNTLGTLSNDTMGVEGARMELCKLLISKNFKYRTTSFSIPTQHDDEDEDGLKEKEDRWKDILLYVECKQHKVTLMKANYEFTAEIWDMTGEPNGKLLFEFKTEHIRDKIRLDHHRGHFTVPLGIPTPSILRSSTGLLTKSEHDKEWYAEEAEEPPWVLQGALVPNDLGPYAPLFEIVLRTDDRDHPNHDRIFDPRANGHKDEYASH